jgi:hypothetical protein
MPAVQLARLNQQIDALAWQFTRPADFLIRIRDLFELYADRVYRAGQAVPPSSLAPAYHVSPLVLRHLELGLRQSCQQHPAAALNLVDALWTQPMLEFRLLASILLGQIPLNDPTQVVDRILQYARPGEDTTALQVLLDKGGRRIRKELPAQWVGLIEQWAGNSNEQAQAVSLAAITITAGDGAFTNFPAIARIFSHLIQAGKPALQAELQEALHALLRRSPQETVYLLRQVLPLSSSPTTHRLARQSLALIPAEYQSSLRQALQSEAETHRGTPG